VTDSQEFSAEIRRVAGIGGEPPTEEIAAARQRLEQARASGDPAAIEAAAREADSLVETVEGTESPDFGAGAGRPVQPEPSMSELIRAAAFGAVVRGGGVR